MAFVVVYDAAVLYPAPLRDLLLRVARTGLVRARWTEQILDECFRNILANRPDRAPQDRLLGTYVVWLLLLAAMAWPCAWYYRRRAGRRAAG